MKMSTGLFACSKCFTRHPFDELSPGQQLCKVSRPRPKFSKLVNKFKFYI